ncbi:MAG: peptidase C39 family protein [Terracoccus sp.]
MTDRHMTLTRWTDDLVWSAVESVEPTDDGAGRARRWKSPVVESSFPATDLTPSWNALTPAGTWLEVEGRVESDLGWTPWLVFARWTSVGQHQDAPVVRTTVNDQRGEWGDVATDTLVAADAHPFSRWQLRLTGLRTDAAATDDDAWPEVSLVAASVAAATAGSAAEATSVPGDATGLELAVPPLSQRLHVDTFPEWDNGGRSWCSPTSVTMLLRYWGLEPTTEETSWVGHDVDPDVVHAVRGVYDPAYRGAGNWAFNVAHVATRGLRAFVTRLRDLTEAEAFVAAGIPLVVSVSFEADQLDGAGYSTRGHLLTVTGFTAEGDVISNDPNSHRVPSNDEVRVVYRRDQFERVWLGRTGGLTYVIHPADHPLPPAPTSEPNW